LKLTRNCVLCGNEIEIIVDEETRKYTGGHYFSHLGRDEDRELEPDPETEYWECDKCFNNWEDDENE